MKYLEKVLFTLIICSLLLCGCSECNTNVHNKDEDKILLTIDETPILYSELEQTKHRYELYSFTEKELIEGIVLEAIVLENAKKYNIIASENEVNEIFDSLVKLNEGELFYDKALEIYGNDDAIRDAYYYSILYDKVKKLIEERFGKQYSIDNSVLECRTKDYVSRYELEEEEKDEFAKAVMDIYLESTQMELFDLYFKVWQYEEAKNAKIEYKNEDITSLFTKYNYEIHENALTYKGEEYVLEMWSITKFQDVFGNLLYIPNEMLRFYEDVQIKGVHNPEKDVKAIYVKLENKSTEPIIITAVVSPYISLNYEQQGATWLNTANGKMNKVELIQNNYGIHYTIMSEKKNEDIEHLLCSFIPYDVE